MTNKKIKNFHKNKIYMDVAMESYKMMSIVLLELRRLFPHDFYTKKCSEWIEKYTETVQEYNEYDEAGCFDFKMDTECKKHRISDNICADIVIRHLHRFSPQNTVILASNLKLMLLETAVDFGFGRQRLDRLIDGLMNCRYYDPTKQLYEETGIEVTSDLNDFDIDKIKPKKTKVSYEEGMEAKRHLTALKAYQDHIRGGENGGQV